MSKNNHTIPLNLDDVGAFLAKFTENSNHVYWISSPDFKKIRYISPSYERIWGRPRQELYQNPEIWITFLHPDDAKQHHPIHEMAKKVRLFGENARYLEQYRIIRPDGDIRWIMDHGFPLYDNEGTCYGVTGIAIDVTEQKMIEADLRWAKEKAECANQAKDEFLANMSHDIRTPLTGIIGLATLLEQELQPSEEKEHAHWIKISGEQLLTLLNSILDIVSLGDRQESHTQFESVGIAQLLQNIAELELPTIKLKHLDLSIEINTSVPVLIRTDPIKLHRILINLLSNAIKFTDQGQIVLTVNYHPSAPHQGQLELTVRDTGQGIAEENQAKVFERFYRGDPSYKGQYAGYGVGLHIVQQYVAQLAGRLHLNSQPGQGTTVTVSIPVEIMTNTARRSYQLATRQEGYPVINDQQIPPMTASATTDVTKQADFCPFLLLVEDNPIALKVLEAIVKQTNGSYLSATTGEQAFELAQAHRFDIIISDLGLPGLSGNQLASAIRTLEKDLGKPPIPIIGLTAHATYDIERASLEAGLNKVVSKPINLAVLETIMRQFLSPQPRHPLLAFGRLEKNIPTADDQLVNLEHLPLLDIKVGVNTLGSIDILHDLLSCLLHDELPREIEAMKKASTEQNWLAIVQRAHHLKSSTLYCGLIRLTHACQYVENYRKADDLIFPSDVYQSFLTLVKQTQAILSQSLHHRS